jgi:FtsP/CotA-like multicopper oxidase with cupredoxin domain
VLDVTLTLSYTKKELNGKPFYLRSINQSIPAPTLSINAADTLRIKVVNQLPPNPPSTEPAAHLRYPNSMNLHTHGLHVPPGLVGPDLYGDYVMDDPQLGIQPGQTRHHEFRIGADHPPGAYWYHPHLHGSTAIQVGSGMAGALMIRGAIDRVPEIAAATERIFMIQAPISGAATPGRLESFSDVASEMPESELLINGVKRPRLVMRRGEVQNWHFINAAIARYLNLRLDGHDLNCYSHDGNTSARMRVYRGETGAGLVMAPGNRDSVLVKAGNPGVYYLHTLPYNMGNELPDQILAELIVIDPPMPMALPSGLLPIPAALAHIDDAELARGGGLKRSIVMRAVFNPSGAPVTMPLASDLLHPPPDELPDWTYQTGSTFMADTVFAMGGAGEAASQAPGMPVEFAPFQSARAQTQIVALGSVEEWTVYNMNKVQHPFHIHVNPFEVIKINGVPIEPFWADTIGLPVGGTPQNPTSITFRTRFLDFSGRYVMHCHILSHEDMGMMQAVEVTDGAPASISR